MRYVMCLLLLFLLPAQFNTFFFIPDSIIHGIPIDLLAPALYVTDILIVVLIILNLPALIKASRVRRPHLMRKALILTLVSLFLILNIATSLSPLISVYKFLKVVELIAIFWIIRTIKLNRNHVISVFLAMALLQLGLSLAQIIGGHSLQGIFYLLGERSFSLSTPGIAKVSMQGVEILRAYGTFPHPNVLGGFYLLLYSFVLFTPSLSSQNRFGIQKNIFIITSTLLILFSFSKVAIFGFAVLTTFHVLRKKSSCMLCKLSSIMVPLALAGVFLLAQGDVETIGKRLWLATTSLMIIREHLFTGVGLGAYLIAQGQFPIPYSYHFLQPVHNIFLLLLAELGIPLFSLLSYLLTQLIVPLRKSPAIMAGLFVIAFIGMFDHYWLTIEQTMLLIPVVFGLMQRERGVI